MKILLAVLNAGLAGHTRSSLAVAHALRDRGHDIIYLIGAQANEKLIEGAGFAYERIAGDWLNSCRPVLRLLPDILRRQQIDLVHSFSDEGLAELVTVSKSLHVPCFFTQCGGPGPAQMLPLDSIVLFSEEVRDRLLREHDLTPESLHVLPSRIDVSRIDVLRASLDSALYPLFMAKYGLDPRARIVLQIARLDPEYRTSILQGIDTVANLRCLGLRVQFVHIGYSDKQHAAWVLEDVRRRIAEVNDEFGCTVAATAQDEGATALHYLGMADAVIGVGRSAFEGMAFRKPTLVIGANGYAGMVTPGHTAALAYYNFSGRNIAEEKPYDCSVEEIAVDLYRVLTDTAYAQELAGFGRRYVEDVLDVRIAAAAYEKMYQEHAVQTYPADRLLRRFAKPLWKLLFHRVTSHNMRSAVRQRLQRAGKAFRRHQSVMPCSAPPRPVLGEGVGGVRARQIERS